MTYVYNATVNRLTGITGANARTFSYDAYGNVTNNGVHGFSYNQAGILVSSTAPAITYKYDGHQRRVQKTENGQTSYTVYNQAGQLLHKKKGGVATDYIYAGSLLIAEKSGSTIDYMHTDLLGSPIKGTNGTSYTEHYTPWGEKWNHPMQLADDVGYTGHQDDVATGLTYMQARYYDPVVGRFMAVDPVQFDGDNPQYFGRYTYVGNNPVNATDPTGEITKVLTTAFKVLRSTAKNGGNFGKALKSEGADFVDNLATFADGQLNIDDVLAVVDIATGIDGELVSDVKDGLKQAENLRLLRCRQR